MKWKLLIIAIFGSFIANAQPTSFTYKNVKINPIVHATMQIYSEGKYLLVDPSVDAIALSKLENPDYIIYTDIHSDHLNIENLKALQLKAETVIIAPKAVQEKILAAIPDKQFHFQILENGQSLKSNKIAFTAIPMYNISPDRLQFHTKGRGNGYVIHLGKTVVYISGDTEDIPEMRALKNIDIAFVCMNLPYTMDVAHAADAVLAFQPKIVIPYHYRGQNGLSDIASFNTTVTDKNPNIKVELLKWY